MNQQNRRTVSFLVMVVLFAMAGCGGPELTDKDLGHVHSGIPKLDGDDKPVQFPRPVAALPPDLDPATQAAVQPSGATLPAFQPSGTTLPAVQPSGSTLPASQSTATLPTAQGT